MSLSPNEQHRLITKYGQWALVTGATSGIGEAISNLLADAGFNLILVGRNGEKLSELEKRYHQVQINTIQADLATEEGNEKVITACQKEEIGLVILSAGFGTSGNFIDNSVLEEVNMLRVNCESLLTLSHYFARYFSTKKRGGIVLLSSMVGFQGAPYAANYAASKAYVQSLGEALHEELASKGVDVLTAAPGPVSSKFGERANMAMDMTMMPNQVAPDILKSLGRRSTVLPGLLTKFLVYSLRTVPRWGKVKIMKIIMGGMTKDHRMKIA